MVFFLGVENNDYDLDEFVNEFDVSFLRKFK